MTEHVYSIGADGLTESSRIESELEDLAPHRYMALETRKRDGAWVSTAVNLVVEGDRVFFRTWSKAGKAKRLRNIPDVRFAASDARGRSTATWLRGKAFLLDHDEGKRVASLINRKYPLLQGLVVRVAHKLRRYTTQHYVIRDIAVVQR
jgi:uncharacterized protein